MNVTTIKEYVGLDLKSKLRHHVEEHHEIPLSTCIDLIDDNEVFRKKKIDAFHYVLNIAEENSKRIHD